MVLAKPKKYIILNWINYIKFWSRCGLYLDVSEYGVNYQIINSETKVSVSGKLVDLRTGKTLWTGSATASSDEQNNNNSSGLIAALVWRR